MALLLLTAVVESDHGHNGIRPSLRRGEGIPAFDYSSRVPEFHR